MGEGWAEEVMVVVARVAAESEAEMVEVVSAAAEWAVEVKGVAIWEEAMEVAVMEVAEWVAEAMGVGKKVAARVAATAAAVTAAVVREAAETVVAMAVVAMAEAELVALMAEATVALEVTVEQVVVGCTDRCRQQTAGSDRRRRRCPCTQQQTLPGWHQSPYGRRSARLVQPARRSDSADHSGLARRQPSP